MSVTHFPSINVITHSDSNLVGKSVNTAISASLPTSSVPTLSSIQQFFAAVEVIASVLSLHPYRA